MFFLNIETSHPPRIINNLRHFLELEIMSCYFLTCIKICTPAKPSFFLTFALLFAQVQIMAKNMVKLTIISIKLKIGTCSKIPIKLQNAAVSMKIVLKRTLDTHLFIV